MDAKSKADFINSVAAGNVIPCPNCGTANEGDSKFCMSCGTKLTVSQAPQAETPAFEPVKEAEASAFEPVKEAEAPAFEPVKKKEIPVQVSRYVEPNNVFAQGLPEWSIEPPQVMVRRH